MSEEIAALVDQSLLKQEEDPGGVSRYGMLETVREFALEQLVASGEVTAVQDAHSAYFLALAEEAAPQLYTEYQEMWLRRLQAEHANLRGVGAVGVEGGPRLCAAIGRGSLAILASSWLLGGRSGWLIRLLKRAQPVDAVDLATRATALTGAGWLAHYQNDFAAAQAALARLSLASEASGVLTVWSRSPWTDAGCAVPGRKPASGGTL